MRLPAEEPRVAAAAGLRALHLQHCRCGAGSSVNPEAAEAAVKAVTPRSSFIQDVERKHGGTSPYTCDRWDLPQKAEHGSAAASASWRAVFPPFRTTCMRWYHAWSGLVGVYYFGLAATGLELLLGVKVRIYGDELPKGERALILSNHRTRVDWMFLWCLCMRTEQLSKLRIVLKDSLKSIPGFGWGMQMSLFIFLTRDRSKDLVHMRELLQYTARNAYATTLLLFPEGTDLSASNVEKSRKFAESDADSAMFVYIFCDATATETVEHLAPALDAVYDVTIAYADYRDPKTGALQRPNEKSLLFGQPPREVHILVQFQWTVNSSAMHWTCCSTRSSNRCLGCAVALEPNHCREEHYNIHHSSTVRSRTAVKDFPVGNEAALKKWLTTSYETKEKQLKAFYEGAADGQPVSFKGVPEHTDEHGVKRAYTAAVLFYLAVMTCISWSMYSWWPVKWYAMSTCCVFTLLGGFCDGLDVLELRLGSIFGMTKHVQPQGAQPHKPHRE
eukprot:8032-Heterococcus_DN1.PRE.2